MKKFIKRHWVNTVLLLIVLLGLGLLLYPSVSDYWNSLHQSRAIANYAEQVANIDNDLYQNLLDQAVEYNRNLSLKSLSMKLSEEEAEEYNSVLDIDNSGMIGNIEIQKIDCSLPIYHGTDEDILQAAIGHLPGTSMPVGGESTHAVLSGHRGLPSAKLFTNLDQLEKGDTFVIRVLDEVLTYEIDQILIVDPGDVASLGIEEGEDLCTLVTCTPYGVNSHRLLVRGHRVKNAKTAIRVTADALLIDKVLVAPFIAAFMLVIIVLIILIRSGKRK